MQHHSTAATTTRTIGNTNRTTLNTFFCNLSLENVLCSLWELIILFCWTVFWFCFVVSFLLVFSSLLSYFVQAIGDVVINKVETKFKIKEIKEGKEYSVNIGDVQSEEVGFCCCFFCYYYSCSCVFNGVNYVLLAYVVLIVVALLLYLNILVSYRLDF